MTIVLAMLSACTQSGTTSPVAKLPCGDYIGTQPPSDRYEIVLGVVALTTSRAGPALQTSETGNPGVERLFAKSGLLIRAGVTVELEAPPELRGRLAIGWGSPGEVSHRVVVANCQPRAGDSAQWLAYAGGYHVDEAMCAALTVRADGREQQVRLGIGTPCPGQAPPEVP